MNLEELKAKAIEAKRVADAATEGPWKQSGSSTVMTEKFSKAEKKLGWVTENTEKRRQTVWVAPETTRKHNTIEFIAASRSLVPELADAVLELIEHNANLMGRILDYRCAFSDEQEKLATATEALKFYADFDAMCYQQGIVPDGWDDFVCDKATEALAKIEGSPKRGTTLCKHGTSTDERCVLCALGEKE